MESINYFDVLGVDPNASLGEIKKAYRKLVFRYHPDRNQGKSAGKKYIKITKAYEILSDPVKRDEYVSGHSSAVTDEPWVVLNDYWETIYHKGVEPGDVTY